MIGTSLRRWLVPPVLVAVTAAVLAVPVRAAPAAQAWVQPELAAAASAARAGGDAVPAVIELDQTADLAALSGDHGAVVAELKRVAGQSQSTVRTALPSGVRVRSALWIVNALVVDLPAANAAGALSALTAVPGVARLLSGATIPAPATSEPPESTVDRRAGPAADQRPAPAVPAGQGGLTEQVSTVPAGTAVGDRAWGIERIGADRAWDELGVTGAGARVAVVDSGVEPGHPDLAGRLATDDPTDPAYPGGWIWYGVDGVARQTVPGDDLGNGTALSSVIVGGAASGTAIGVAPGAKLMHAKVMDRSGMSLAGILAGLQWTVAPTDAAGNPAGAPADVVTMRFGVPDQYLPDLTQATRALLASGAIPVFAVGDGFCREGSTALGYIRDALGVGVTDRADSVPDNSCGGVVTKAGWPNAPADWPATYVKPDLTAPGVDMPNARWIGGYGTFMGSVYAAAYVAGVAALMRAAAPEAPATDVMTALKQTAVFDDRHGTDRPNTRYGAGRVDALAAVRAVAGWAGVSGRVVDDRSGQPVAAARVSDKDSARVATTDADGRFRLPIQAGAHTVTVSAATYGSRDVLVTVPQDATATADVRLTPGAAGALRGTVVYGDGRAGVPGATVLVTKGTTTVHATTGADGRYELPRLEPGEYQVSARASGLLPSAGKDVRIADGDGAAGDLLVRPPTGADRVSAGLGGAAADSDSRGTSVSADGRFVAFESCASNLIADDPSPGCHVYVRDRQAGTTERVSVGDDGTAGDSSSYNASISADGRYVAFASSATNLAPGDTNNSTDIFLRDRRTGTTTLVSHTAAGTPGDGYAGNGVVSADGRFVAFDSWATNLVPGDTNGVTDVFEYDTASGAVTRLSRTPDGGQSNGWSGEPDVSADGSRVVFSSQGNNLVPGDANGAQDVFVADVATGRVTLASVATDGTQDDFGASSPSISGDGATVAFSSAATTLTPDDRRGMPKVFTHDVATGRTTLVSVNTAGVPADDQSDFPALSGDGRYVAFRSYADNLYAGDVNGASDVFVRDVVAGTTEPVVASPLAGDGWTAYPDISADGRFVSLDSMPHDAFIGRGHEDVYVVDRDPPAEHGARFAVSDVTVDPTPVPRGAPVTVSALVTNIGDAPGSYTGGPLVDGSALQGAPVSLASGAARTVTWTASSDQLGSHELRLGQYTGTFRVRRPLATVHASTVDGKPLAGATVSLVRDGYPVPFGVTGQDGRVTAELPVADATAVVSKAPAGKSSGYLLTAPVRAGDGDVEVTLAPQTGNRDTAVLDLLPRKGTASSLTYVSPAFAPAVAVAVPPGQVVVTLGEYTLRHAYRITRPEREWWALSATRSAHLTEAKRYKTEFGGATTVTLHATRGATPTAVTLDWSVTDAGGVAYDVIARGPLGSPAPPSLPSVTLASEVAALVGARAPRREDVIVRVYDPTGRQITAGGLAWDQPSVDRDLTAWLSDVPPGQYRFDVAVGADDSPFGPLTATTSVALG